MRAVVFSERPRIGSHILSLSGPYPNGLYDSVTVYVSVETYISPLFDEWIKEQVITRLAVRGTLSIIIET